MSENRTYICPRCDRPTDLQYSDSGVLAIIHGQWLCRTCYIADGHPECPQCKRLTYKEFKFCPWCGAVMHNNHIDKRKYTHEER